MTGFGEIRVDAAEGVATITPHRPDRLNAFTAAMARELVAAFDATDADEDVRVVLLMGAGRGFCAGPTSAAERAPSTPRTSAGSPSGGPRHGRRTGTSRSGPWPPRGGPTRRSSATW